MAPDPAAASGGWPDAGELGVGPHPEPWPDDPRLDRELLQAGDRRNVVDRYRYWRVDAIVADLDTRRHPFHVAVENWRHDLNIGAVVRNANAFLAARVHIVGRRRWNRRGPVGTDLHPPVFPHPHAAHPGRRAALHAALADGGGAVILDRFRLTDKVAVVTGAGRGIGAATAVAFAEAGADVVISSRTESQLEEVAARVEQAGRQAAVVPADLADVDAVAGLAATARESFGRLDVVVNNVGGTIPNAFMKTSTRYLEEAFHFNVTTAHALTRAAVPVMLEGDGGTVVNIASTMGRVSGRGFVAYGTAKGALIHYTRLAARDLAPRIRMNAIGVGSVETSALEFVLTDDATRTAMEQATP